MIEDIKKVDFNLDYAEQNYNVRIERVRSFGKVIWRASNFAWPDAGGLLTTLLVERHTFYDLIVALETHDYSKLSASSRGGQR